MIFSVGSYANCQKGKCISISRNEESRVDFTGPRIRELAPKTAWWQEWHDNIGKVSEDENMAFFIKSYYESILKPLGPDRIMLMAPLDSIFTSYEDPEDFSHREILAAYLELYYDQPVYEVKVNDDGKLIRIMKNRFYNATKEYLEELIKKDIEMYGYNSIAAAHSYRRSLDLERNPKLCEKFLISPESYRRLAESQEKRYLEVHNGKRVG